MKKLLSLIIILSTLLSAVYLPVSADTSPEPEAAVMAVDPRLANGDSCTTSFTVSSSGVASVRVTYLGISGVTTKVTSKIYIEKKFLGLFWIRVDLGITDDQWTDSSTNVAGSFSHSVNLESKGTYRAVFYVTMAGSGGSTDVIEKTIEKKYS